jgi:type IV pilus assembly protein PilB
VSGRLKLGQILVNRGILAPDQLAAALADQQENGTRLGMTLVRMGFVDEETLIRTLAGQVKLPVARIRGKRVSPDVLECIPVDLAEKHRCLPLFFKQEGGERVLFVAMEDPSDSDAIDAIASASGQVLRLVLVGPTELEEALQRHYHWASLTGETPEWLVTRTPDEASEAPDPGPTPEPASDPDPDPDAEPAWAGEPPGDLEPGDGEWEGASGSEDDLDDELLGGDEELGLDLESGAASDLEDEASPFGAVLMPASHWLGERPDADTAPELPTGDGDLADLADGAGQDLGSEGERGLGDPAPAQAGNPTPRPESLDPSIILRALSQLLVEKGVISRDEFVQRLGELAAREAGRG